MLQFFLFSIVLEDVPADYLDDQHSKFQSF